MPMTIQDNNMTPQTQAEQKTRELLMGFQNAMDTTGQDIVPFIHELELLIQKADENDSIVKALPPTFYADLPLYKRVEFMWEQWNRAIKCLQELELQNDSLKEKADALDWVQENHFTIMACHQPKTFMCVSMGKPSGVNTSLLSAINQARKEQQ
jgi:hypothetical protein